MLKAYYDKNDIFNMENGMHMVSGEPGKAVFELEITKKHLSLVGRPHVHPGVIYSLAESASGAAALAYGYNCFAVEGKIEYLGTATEGIIRAEAKCKDEHDRETGQVRVRVYDAAGNLISRCYFVIVYTGEPFEA